MRFHTERITENSRFWDRVNTLAKEAFPPEEYLAPSKLMEMGRGIPAQILLQMIESFKKENPL